MPTKNSSGSLISYGPAFPADALTPDGALFFKTAESPGFPIGLYVFGFIDLDTTDISVPTTQGWKSVENPNVVTGVDADTLDGLDSTAFQAANTVLSGLSSLGANTGIVVKTGASAFAGKSIAQPSGDTSISITNGSGTAAGNIELAVNQASLNLNSIGGASNILTTAKGGTGANLTLPPGGIIYASSASTMASSAAGTATYLLSANGTSAPTWVNPLDLSVSYANSSDTANSAGELDPGAQIDIVGPTGNLGWIDATATAFTGASNIAININSINGGILTGPNSVPDGVVGWANIGNLSTGSRTFTASPAAGFSTIARPSLFYDMGSTGASSMTPTQFQAGSITGFDALNTSDLGVNQVGLTVVGTSGNRGVQIAADWNFEETAPSSGLRYRVNDTTGTPAAWGAWRTIVDEGHSIFNNYVSKNDTNLQTLTGAFQTTALLVGTGSVPSAGGIFASGNISTTSGYIQVGSVAGSNGYIRLQSSATSLSSGKVEFYSGTDVRQGFFECASNVLTPGDSGTLSYVGAAHAFTGHVTVTGNISAEGNVTAFFVSSDERLKENIDSIPSALDKVMALRGVNYTMKESGRRETGLIAQEVLAVVPEAVREGTDGFYGVAYGNLVGLLVEAIKDQQRQIDELKAQLNK